MRAVVAPPGADQPGAVGSSADQLSAARSSEMSSVSRTEVVRPGMCGHNSLFVGQIGDWTWDAVSALCGTDVLCARDRSGAPTYLSFYYFRIRAGRTFHVRTPSFGDRLRIDSQLYDFGSESVLTRHRIRRAAPAAPLPPASPISPHEFGIADAGCLYAETFNRWVTRGQAESNADLRRCSPVGFRHAHLPTLPAAYSPRLVCQRARTRLTFVDEDASRHTRVGAPLRAHYTVDVSRDLNGVGLLYFASYFSVVDWVLLRLWHRLGRDDESFLGRVVLDQQLCYLGNADAGCVIEATAQRWRAVGDPAHELVDVVLRDRASERLLAVCTLTLLVDQRSGGVS